MGPTHNKQNSPGGPKKGGSVNITTAGSYSQGGKQHSLILPKCQQKTMN